MLQLEPAIQRRILSFLNEAVQSQELAYAKLPLPKPESEPIHEDHLEPRKLERAK